MATFYFELTKDVQIKDIKRKFDAFVELYGESEIFVKGDIDELTSSGNVLPLFNINAKVVKIGNKFIDAVMNGAKVKIILPSNSPYTYKTTFNKTQIMFISVWI